MSIFGAITEKILKICAAEGLLGERITIKARPLTPQEAIGNPEDNDFPLQKGKERLMQAEFRGAFGQAFSDQYGDFEGPLSRIFHTPLMNNFRRALFVASLNAVLRCLGQIEGTVHCKDQEPGACARRLCEYLRSRYGDGVKVAQIGFQPRFVEALSPSVQLRVSDLDSDNIGTTRFNTLIEGPESAQDLIKWADLLLVTGTTIVNGTIGQFLGNKPVIFYGTTIAGAAHLMGWRRFCAYSK